MYFAWNKGGLFWTNIWALWAVWLIKTFGGFVWHEWSTMCWLLGACFARFLFVVWCVCVFVNNFCVAEAFFFADVWCGAILVP